MKRIALIIIFFAISLFSIAQDNIVTLPNGKKVILYNDKTWDYYGEMKYDFDFSKLSPNNIPTFLRQGIKVDINTLKTAVEMYLQGWRYSMPFPKSKQASWGNYDGRTTWYYGYWYNESLDKYSSSTPKKHSNGSYIGDNQNNSNSYRNGGSPSTPTKLEWLLSSSGGIKPN